MATLWLITSLTIQGETYCPAWSPEKPVPLWQPQSGPFSYNYSRPPRSLGQAKGHGFGTQITEDTCVAWRGQKGGTKHPACPGGTDGPPWTSGPSIFISGVTGPLTPQTRVLEVGVEGEEWRGEILNLCILEKSWFENVPFEFQFPLILKVLTNKTHFPAAALPG